MFSKKIFILSIAILTSVGVADAKQSLKECLDSVCKSVVAEDKGRCRCSKSVVRFMLTERKISDVEEEISKRNRVTTISSSGVPSEQISEQLESIYKSLDVANDEANVALQSFYSEGEGLVNYALTKCDLKENSEEFVLYKNLVNKDCKVYSDNLQERLELATNLLTTAIKNQEKVREIAYKKYNILSEDECFSEYQNCMLLECGKKYKECENETIREAMFTKCKAALKNKCEAMKDKIIRKVDDFIDEKLMGY